MSSLWGELKEDEKKDGAEQVLPNEVVKYFVMQGMITEPYRTPAPNPVIEKPVLLSETHGLEIDDRVIHSLKLMQHMKLVETAKEQLSILSEAQVEAIPPALEIPDHPLPPRRQPNCSDFTLGRTMPIPSVTSETARLLLGKSVAALTCLAGFETATESVLATFIDATHIYLKQMVSALRIAVDQGANVGATGFPDAIERVFTEIGIGSVLELGKYYQERIINNRQNLMEQCEMLNREYIRIAHPGAMHLEEIEKMEEPDSVPEIHFPAMVEDNPSELQSSLETGFQMLYNLEQEIQMQMQLDSQEDSPITDAGESLDSRKRKRL